MLIDKLKTAKAGRLVFVGCDGPIFLRDARRLAPEWELSKLAVIDLFPNTRQCEFVGLFARN